MKKTEHTDKEKIRQAINEYGKRNKQIIRELFPEHPDIIWCAMVGIPATNIGNGLFVIGNGSDETHKALIEYVYDLVIKKTGYADRQQYEIDS